MDLSILKDAGLTEGEIKVYLSLLELGPSTTGPIIQKSGVARSIIYQILEKLMTKGLVSYITKQRTKYYQSSSPKKLIEYISDRERQLQEHKRKIESLIPQLLLKQKSVVENEANFYLGFEGIRTAHERIYTKLKRGDAFYYFGIPNFQPTPQHAYWQKDHKKRIAKGIYCYMLFNKDTDPMILENRNSYKLCDSRYMPLDVVTPAFFLVYKDTVVIITQYPQSLAVEIVNQTVADSFKAYYDAFWKESKPFKSK